MRDKVDKDEITPFHTSQRLRPKVTDEIIETLRRDIAGGKLRQGLRLPSERDLARQFGVSQPTIREAIRVLDTMGLIQVRHGSGAYVTGDSAKFLAASLDTLLEIERVGIIEVLEVRAILGEYTASRAATHATHEDLQEICREADALEQVGTERDIQRIADRVVSFQIAISSAAHNPLQFAIESFLVRLLMKFQLTAKTRSGIRFWRKWTLQFNEDRRHLVDALLAHDQADAVKRMAVYLDDLRAVFASDPDIAKLRLSDSASVQTGSPDRALGIPVSELGSD